MSLTQIFESLVTFPDSILQQESGEVTRVINFTQFARADRLALQTLKPAQGSQQQPPFPGHDSRLRLGLGALQCQVGSDPDQSLLNCYVYSNVYSLLIFPPEYK